jgi:formate dehydrogenase major subunit
MGFLRKLGEWPFLQQIRNGDFKAENGLARSKETEKLEARTRKADQVVRSVCPFCAVGCGQLVHVQKGKLTSIEGDPDSPISRGRLCPKGAATFQLVANARREKHVLYRKPHGARWERIPLATAMDMVAERVKAARDSTWEDMSPEGKPLRRTLGIAHLGGATLDNEENYLIKKLWTALGIVQVENQARI